MSRRKRLYAGQRVRAVRRHSGLNQAAMAEALGISTSYLSQIENDERPITPQVLTALSRHFAFELEDAPEGAPSLNWQSLLDDPVLAGVEVDPARLARLRDSHPEIAHIITNLYQGYRQAAERSAMLDDSLAATGQHNARLPWEEVRDWFHESGNYIDQLDRNAEQIAEELGEDLNPDGLIARLHRDHGITVKP